jgi:hypothetical protein
MKNQNKLFKLNIGQSTVEYILLLAVIISLSIGFIRSSIIKNLLGEDGIVAERFRSVLEHTYRHAYFGVLSTPLQPFDRIAVPHPSYFNKEKSTSRFFLTLKYGN